MQLLSKAFIAGQTIAKMVTKTFMPALALELAKQSEKQTSQQKNQKFFEKLKKDPNVFVQIVKRAKDKVLNQLVNIKQKLVEIKKSIAKLTVSINQTKRRISFLSGRAQKLQKELADIRNKIKQLEKLPGKENEIEALKNREKEILQTLSELAKKIELEQARLKEFEQTQKDLVTEKNTLELAERKCQIRLNELDEYKTNFEQAMGIAPKHEKPLTEILQRGREEKSAREQIESTELSYGNFAFKATLDSDFNMHDVQSQKVIPVFNRIGKTTPEFMKQIRYTQDDSIVAQYSVRSKFVADRLHQAESNGHHVTPASQNKERGGRDDYPGRS